NRTEKSQPVLKKCHEYTERQFSSRDLEPSVRQQHGECQHAQKLDNRIEPAIRRNRVLEGDHMFAVDALELLNALRFPVEQLQHGDAVDVLLKVCVDLRYRYTNAAVTLRNGVPEIPSHQDH